MKSIYQNQDLQSGRGNGGEGEERERKEDFTPEFITGYFLTFPMNH